MTTPAGPGAATADGQVTGTQGVQPGEGSSPAGQGGQSAGQQPQGGLYDKYLADLPGAVHPQVTKAFQSWDADMTRRQQELQSRYAPYQPLIDSGADPQRLQAAAQFADWFEATAEDNPIDVFAGVGQALGLDPEQVAQALSPLVGGGAQQQDQGPAAGAGTPGGGTDEVPAWFAQYRQQVEADRQADRKLLELLAQERVASHESSQQEQAAASLETELRQQAQTAGVDLDDPDAQFYILARLEGTDDQVPQEQAVRQAIDAWQKLTNGIRGQQASAGVPPVLGGGGGLPSQQVDPTSLSTADRRKLVAQNAARLMSTGG